jgi:hypothetical protein
LNTPKLLLLFGLALLLSACKDQCSFNIDRYELLTGVDIPKTKKADCRCDDQANISYFLLEIDDLKNTSYLDLEGYAARYQFEAKKNFEIMGENEADAGFDSNRMLVKENKEEGWQLLLNMDNGEMRAYREIDA